MNKLGRREYLKMFCESLVATYGNTLVEHNTDIAMATALMRKLRKYLFFHSSDMNDAEWIKWRKKFLATYMNITKSEVEERMKEGYIRIKIPGKLRSLLGQQE